MKKGKKGITIFLICLLLAGIFPMQAFAAGKIDIDKDVTLHIEYKDGLMPIAGAMFCIYRIADVDEYGHMTLTPKYEKYKDTISGLNDLEHLTQEKWMEIASTLKSFIAADGLYPDVLPRPQSDAEGRTTVVLKPGLYLFSGCRATTLDFYTYSVVPSMLFLPGLDKEANEWDYDVTISPKFTKDYDPHDDPDDDLVTRKVLKVWDDEGYESIRPKELVVQLIRDDSVYDTKILSKENNWRYAWDNLDAKHEWTIAEVVPEGYTVKIARTGITFTITNKFEMPIVLADPMVQKKLLGEKPKTKAEFTFVLEAADPSCPMPGGSTGMKKEIKIEGAGIRGLGRLTFDKAGTYVYTVRELDGGEPGYRYDSNVYTLTYVVTENLEEKKLDITETFTDAKGRVVPRIEFANVCGTVLPQTGMLWWPVPVLLFAGAVLVAFGVSRRRRSNR